MSSLFAVTASVGEFSSNSPTIAVAANKLDIYHMLFIPHTVYELLMMAGKTPETCRALAAINSIV